MTIVDFHMHITTAHEYAHWFMEWLRPAMPYDPREYLEKNP